MGKIRRQDRELMTRRRKAGETERKALVACAVHPHLRTARHQFSQAFTYSFNCMTSVPALCQTLA
jgi:hypothetical protein